MRYAGSIWCMTSSYSEFETVFVRPHVKEKPTFSKIYTLKSSIEKVGFRWSFFTALVSLEGRLNRRKNIRFQTKPDTREKQKLCASIKYFCTFRCRHCMTMAWTFLTWRIMETVNVRQRLPFLFLKTVILNFRTQLPEKSLTYLTTLAWWITSDKVWQSADAFC